MKGVTELSFRTVFIESRCRCSYKGGYLVVRKENGTAKIHLSEIAIIVLETTQIFISAYLLAELAKQKIPLVVSDEKHNPVGEYLPIYGAHNTSKRIQEQIAWSEPSKKRLWQRVVRDKIYQQELVLRYALCDEVADKLKTYHLEVRSGDTTNREAAAACLYFESLFGEGFSRAYDTPVNASLNYGYAILLSRVNREIVARGYFTQVGICHRNEYNPFNLSCDFMEPFRPIVDRLVIDNLFDEFSPEIRKILADMMNVRVSYRGGIYKLGSVVSQYVQDCLNVLNKNIEASDISSFVWRNE